MDEKLIIYRAIFANDLRDTSGIMLPDQSVLIIAHSFKEIASAVIEVLDGNEHATLGFLENLGIDWVIMTDGVNLAGPPPFPGDSNLSGLYGKRPD